ncbi:MAG: hypothetical protein WBG86_02650, partial [Polyangiales bacterium]
GSQGAGNTELEVLVASGKVLVASVEYTVVCQGAADDDEVRREGSFEVLDNNALTQGAPEVFSGFVDLPPGPCSIQVRGRDNDGEVLCVTEEQFAVLESSPTQLRLLLSCGGGGITPMEPVVGFNICPDLFPIECLELEEGTSSCELIFRDEDETCDMGCDPQTCMATENGLSCIPGPDPGVSTWVACQEDALDCNGDGAIDESCTYRSGRDSFFVECAASGLSGSTVTCTVVTTDGDADCDRVEVVEVECPSVEF